MLNSELPSLIQICQVAQRVIRSSVNLTTNTYVRVTEFTWILFIFSKILSFSFSLSLCDASGLLSLLSSSLLSRQTSSVPQLFVRTVRLLDTIANDFYSCSLFSSLLPPVAMDWWARNDNFPSLSFCCCCCCFFFTCSFSLFKRALSSGRHVPRRQRLGKGLWGLRASNSIKHQILRFPFTFKLPFFFNF